MWKLVCFPNGMWLPNFDEMIEYNKGYVSLYLRICYLPPNIKEMKIKFSFKCKETDDKCVKLIVLIIIIHHGE